MNKLAGGTKAFVIDYVERHKHPLNAILHIFGVPMAFYGVWCLITGNITAAVAWLICGYFLQWLGHSVQGNEVGEVTLIKNIYRKLTTRRGTEGGSN